MHAFALRGIRAGLESAVEPKREADGGLQLARNLDLHGAVRGEE